MIDNDIQELATFLKKWEDAGAFGHIVISVRPHHSKDPDEIGICSYITFGPAEDSDDHLKLVAFMDKILDTIATKITDH